MAKTLILVHPGSVPRECRSSIYAEVERHEGAFVVIDGDLSDNLEDLGYDAKIAAALTRAADAGYLALRVFGCDDALEPFEGWEGHRPAGYGGSIAFRSQQEAAAAFAHLLPEQDIILTGAWVDEENNEGCVVSVGDAIREVLGDKVRIAISDAAAHVLSEDEDEDDDFEDDCDESVLRRVTGL